MAATDFTAKPVFVQVNQTRSQIRVICLLMCNFWIAHLTTLHVPTETLEPQRTLRRWKISHNLLHNVSILVKLKEPSDSQADNHQCCATQRISLCRNRAAIYRIRPLTTGTWTIQAATIPGAATKN